MFLQNVTIYLHILHEVVITEVYQLIQNFRIGNADIIIIIEISLYAWLIGSNYPTGRPPVTIINFMTC